MSKNKDIYHYQLIKAVESLHSINMPLAQSRRIWRVGASFSNCCKWHQTIVFYGIRFIHLKMLVLTLVQIQLWKTSSQEWWEVKTHLQRSKSPITGKVVITLINDNYCTCMEIGFVLLNICHSEFLQEHLGSGSETEPPAWAIRYQLVQWLATDESVTTDQSPVGGQSRQWQ